MTDDEKYKSLRDSLKSLRKLKARGDFNERLFQRIKLAEEAEVFSKSNSVTEYKGEIKSKNWFANLFRPSLAPALGLTVILLVGIVVYFAYYSQLKKEETVTSRNFNISSGSDKPELVIYLKKDTSNYSGNYPHEYSALSNNEISNPESKPDLDKTSTDFRSIKPSPTTEEKEKILDDRLSKEQKYEMQRSSDVIPKGSVDEKKSEKKSDGIERMDKKAPSNYLREEHNGEKKEDNKDNINTNDADQQINAPALKSDDKSGDTITTGKAEPETRDHGKLSKNKTDSLKAQQRVPLNIEEPDSTKK